VRRIEWVTSRDQVHITWSLYVEVSSGQRMICTWQFWEVVYSLVCIRPPRGVIAVSLGSYSVEREISKFMAMGLGLPRVTLLGDCQYAFCDVRVFQPLGWRFLQWKAKDKTGLSTVGRWLGNWRPDLWSTCPVTKYKCTNYPVINSCVWYVCLYITGVGLFFTSPADINPGRFIRVCNDGGFQGPQGITR
jgi:hypothetical protein